MNSKAGSSPKPAPQSLEYEITHRYLILSILLRKNGYPRKTETAQAQQYFIVD
jgi:hypothetical protein